MANRGSATGTGRLRREYDTYAARYDHETGWYDRVMLGDGRAWACSHAQGAVLEVAIGTGLNVPHYPRDVVLTGVDLSGGMLAGATERAHRLGRPVGLVQGDAHRLPFSDGTFDTVLCTLGMNSIPEPRVALAEMRRVMRARARLVLLGHVASPYVPVRAAQRLLERAAANRPADSQTRRIAELLPPAGFTVVYQRRSRAGIIERLVAIGTDST